MESDFLNPDDFLTIHGPIGTQDWPSRPAPWSSTDLGESWVWDDYIVIFQTEPITVAEALGMQSVAMLGSQLKYLFAANVFHHVKSVSARPLNEPVLVIGLEQLKRPLGITSLDTDKTPPTMVGLFNAKGRCNLGFFTNELTRDSARSYFFELIRKCLSLKGQPVKVGIMSDIHGCPSTGWPG